MKTLVLYYRPQTKLSEGNVFTLVCHSFFRGKGSFPLDTEAPGVRPPPDRDPLDTDPPGQRPPPGLTSSGSPKAGVMHPTEMHTCDLLVLTKNITIVISFVLMLMISKS